MHENILLTFLLILPFVGTLLIGIMPATASRLAAIFITAVMCVVSTQLAISFNPHSLDMQFVQKVTWFAQPIPVEYHVGVDGMGLCLVVLTSFVMLMSVLASHCLLYTSPSPRD